MTGGQQIQRRGGNMGKKSRSAKKRGPLTERQVADLGAGKCSGTLGDLPGVLMVRAEAKGKTFFYRYRNDIDGDRLVRIGRYDPRGAPHGFTLKAAAAKARELAEQVRKTPDYSVQRRLEDAREVEARRAELQQRQAAAERTLGVLCEVYTDYLKRQGKIAHRDARNLLRLHLGALRETPAAVVTAAEVAAVMRRLVEAGKMRTAGKLRSYLSAAYALALRAESDPAAPSAAIGFNVAANPAAAVKARSGVQARDRVLSANELRHFMRRAADLQGATGDAFALLLLLGGQRPVQLLRATLADVQDGYLTLRDPKGRRAAARLHVLPLSDMAAQIVQRCGERAQALGGAYLFTSQGRVPLRVETLSAAALAICRAMQEAGECGEAFQLRDLRRTVETEMAALGISRDVRAQLLSHGLSGVQAQHYDRHDYLRDKAAALAAWERRLAEIRDGTARAVNVVPLVRAA